MWAKTELVGSVLAIMILSSFEVPGKFGFGERKMCTSLARYLYEVVMPAQCRLDDGNKQDTNRTSKQTVKASYPWIASAIDGNIDQLRLHISVGISRAPGMTDSVPNMFFWAVCRDHVQYARHRRPPTATRPRPAKCSTVWPPLHVHRSNSKCGLRVAGSGLR
jgi:hypothetical protein